MTRKIYVNEDTLKEAVDYINDEITFFGFLSNVKTFLKDLLNNPTSAEINDYLKRHGVDKKTLLNALIDRGIVEKTTKIDSTGDKDKFCIQYKIPKHNFERKMNRLYISMFEKNEICENVIFEDGGACAGGTGCATSGDGGATSSSSSGQVIQPLGKVQRRKIYVTNEQCKMLKEMGAIDAGDYAYDVPFGLDKSDPAFDHKNMIAKGSPNKKKGVRLKKK